MLKYKKYCDICGRRITNDKRIKTNLLQKLKLISIIFTMCTIFPKLDGDLGDVCNDCLVSFRTWVKIRISNGR